MRGNDFEKKKVDPLIFKPLDSAWSVDPTRRLLISLTQSLISDTIDIFDVDILVKSFLVNCFVFLKHFLWQCCSEYENQRRRKSSRFWLVFYLIEFHTKVKSSSCMYIPILFFRKVEFYCFPSWTKMDFTVQVYMWWLNHHK